MSWRRKLQESDLDRIWSEEGSHYKKNAIGKEQMEES